VIFQFNASNAGSYWLISEVAGELSVLEAKAWAADRALREILGRVGV
jgi:hypothetical protein